MKSLFYYRNRANSKMGFIRKEKQLGLIGNSIFFEKISFRKADDQENFAPSCREIIFPQNAVIPVFENTVNLDEDTRCFSITTKALAIFAIVVLTIICCLKFFA